MDYEHEEQKTVMTQFGSVADMTRLCVPERPALSDLVSLMVKPLVRDQIDNLESVNGDAFIDFYNGFSVHLFVDAPNEEYMYVAQLLVKDEYGMYRFVLPVTDDPTKVVDETNNLPALQKFLNQVAVLKVVAPATEKADMLNTNGMTIALMAASSVYFPVRSSYGMSVHRMIRENYKSMRTLT